MEALFIYLIISLLIIATIIVFSFINYNKIQDIVTRINESEANIDTNLRNKYDALNRAIAIIKGNTKIKKEIFEEIIKLRSRKISNFELERKLVDATNEFLILKEEYKDLYENSEELKKIAKIITTSDEKIVTLKQYYNENIAAYNRLIKTFPTNIIAKFNNCKEKLFFDKKDMSDDDFQDFKL